MGLERIKGQDSAVSLLTSAYASGRLSHAYLFHGPDGVGKEAVALEFARALHCETDGLESCGSCSACRMADGLSHPDTHLIFPVPTTIKPAELAELKASGLKAGFRDQDFGRKTAVISVDTVLSEVVVKANKRPYIGPWKVFIIADADRMTTEAANTLLKTLEEPPEQTVIVLTTSRPTALPATVISRCQRVAFGRLSRKDVEAVLLADPRLGFEPKEAKAAAAMAQGCPGVAVRSGRAGLAGELRSVALIMGGSRLTNASSLLDEANRLAYRLGRDEQQKFLNLMLLWLRDVLQLSQLRGSGGSSAGTGGGNASGTGEPEILYAGHRAEIERMADSMNVDDLEQLIHKVDDARRAIERYSNPSIVFTSVLLDLAVVRKRASTRRGAAHGVR